MGLYTTLYQVSVVNPLTVTFLHVNLFPQHSHNNTVVIICLFTFNLELIYVSVASSEGPRVERFSFNPTSGELRTASPLRWAERAEYAFTVTAADHGTPGLSSTCQIRIQVNNICTFSYPRSSSSTNACTISKAAGNWKQRPIWWPNLKLSHLHITSVLLHSLLRVISSNCAQSEQYNCQKNWKRR